MLKKLLLLIALFFLVTPSAMAQIRTSGVSNVASSESAYTLNGKFDAKGNLLPSKKGEKTSALFSVYVKSTRFYNKKLTNFRRLEELAITSNAKAIDLLFDKSLPPRLEYLDKTGTWHKLTVGKITYCDAYFISFKIDASYLKPLKDATALRIVFPYITNGTKETDNPYGIYLKKTLQDDSKVAYISYPLPLSLREEWQQVLNS